MAITLNLRQENGQLVVDFDDQHDRMRTSLGALPPIVRLQADPFTHGKTLTSALGGETYLLTRLQADPDNLILLNCDDAADSFAWEFATCSDGQFLCIKAGMLRTVQRDAPPFTGDGAINFVALAADPLVDEQGNPREGYRLDLDNEMKAIRTTLQSCGKSLEAKRIPPIREELYKALRKGPAILHLSCHGNVVPTENGPMAILSLEKKDGSHDPFAGSDLMNTKRGILRLILLSACKTATGTEANLARALALNGIPMTVGMQESIDDTLSDEIATALYDSLFSGFTFGEALQQARQNISQRFESVGLLVGYVARNGWKESLPLRNGIPSVGNLGKPGVAALGGEIQAPRPLLGRNLELHQLAKLFSSGQKVITVAGTGGMGKTALAAAFAERFAWMWSQGVRAYSFANEVNFTSFIAALLRTLYGNEAAIQMATLPDNEKRQVVLDSTSQWDGLWLFDNYESIMQGLQENNAEAERIHRLIGDLANGGVALLLTSREQPAGLKNERLFPESRHLAGLREEAGMALFFQHSVKAKENPKAHLKFALQIQHVAEGHPLAIALLAGEYDTSAVSQADFLQNWHDELASARREGLAGHHVTFTIAFERSYAHLSKDLQEELALLSIFPFPFFAHGAVMIWDGSHLPDGDEEIDAKVNAAQQTLSEFTRRSLLEVDATYKDDTPRTYRFQPALRQEAARRLDFTLIQNQQVGYAAYGAWLAKRGYGDIHSDLALNRVVRLSMDAMEKAIDSLQGVQRLWHISRLAWLKRTWGEAHVAFDLLSSAISENLPDPQADPENAKAENSLRFELAWIYVTRGDLDHALVLYQDGLQLLRQLADQRGIATALSNMAQVFLTRGDLDRALELFQESLQLFEQLGNISGKTAPLHAMARIYYIRGDLDRSMSLSRENLQLLDKLGDKQVKAAEINSLALVFLNRGELDRAMALYEESLQLLEQLGNKQGKAAALGQLANLYMAKKEWEHAEKLLLEAFELVKAIGEPPAFETIQLGQVAQARGDKETALARYRECLAIFERMGMPESQQVRKMIASLEGGAVSNNDPLAQVLAQARDASQRGDVGAAIQYQEQAVSLARGAGEGREVLVRLSVILYNLAGFYQKAERHDDAVKVMEEVVAIDEKTGHQDLVSDRETLEALRRIASLTPEEREKALTPDLSPTSERGEQEDGFEAQLQAQLAQLPPEQRAEAEAQIRKAYAEFQRMSPEEQARALQAANDQRNRAQIDKAANQARDAGLAYVRKQAPKRDVLQMLEGASKQMKDGESAGSPWLEVAALCDALVALIQEESIPPVPAAYASHFSAVQSEISKLRT